MKILIMVVRYAGNLLDRIVTRVIIVWRIWSVLGLQAVIKYANALLPNMKPGTTNALLRREKCTTLINGPCNKSSECTNNSECIDANRRKLCRCKKGFNAVDRKCDLAFGESCVQGQSYPKCDRLGPL